MENAHKYGNEVHQLFACQKIELNIATPHCALRVAVVNLERNENEKKQQNAPRNTFYFGIGARMTTQMILECRYIETGRADEHKE